MFYETLSSVQPHSKHVSSLRRYRDLDKTERLYHDFNRYKKSQCNLKTLRYLAVGKNHIKAVKVNKAHRII